MIKIEGLSKKLGGAPVLNGINMTVESGSIYGLVGTNGAGKTTLIRHLAGFLKPDRGSITYDDQPVWENRDLKEKIGLIPDELYFPAGYSLADMKKLYARIYPNFSEDRFHAMTKLFHLKEKQKIRSFSKGMKKQAAFCLVLAAYPDYLLLDEPIDGLDPIVRNIIWKFIMDDVADRRMSVLVSSHNLKEMDDVCDHVGILSEGKMLLERDLDDVKADMHKVQVAFGRDRRNFESDPFAGLDVRSRETRGGVDLLVVRGSQEEIENALNPWRPAVLDILPLTLEEIFIYELGGDDDEIRKLLF